MSTKKKVIITVTILSFILVLVFCIVMFNLLQIPEVIRCERLTAKYGHEFEDPEVYKNFDWIYDVKDVKVLKYTPGKAKVYYICGGVSETGHEWSRGIVAEYLKVSSNKWERSYEVVKWTYGTGNADGIVMPYWWHSILIG